MAVTPSSRLTSSVAVWTQRPQAIQTYSFKSGGFAAAALGLRAGASARPRPAAPSTSTIGEEALAVAGQKLRGRVLRVPRRVRQHVSDIKIGESPLELIVHLSSRRSINVSFAGENVVHAAFR
jgi:hypothetical protein